MKNFLIAIVTLLLVSCADEKKPTSKPSTPEAKTFPSLPTHRIQDLYRKCISVDIIAYTMGISMSYNDPESIRPVLAFLTINPGTIQPNCKSVGRISFMTEEGIGEEAEMYIHNGCRTFVWLEDGKPAYSNQLTHEGLDFFTRFIPENPADFKMPEGGKPSK